MNTVRNPLCGSVVLTANAESGALEKVKIIGTRGTFDQFPIYVWEWLSGPDKGQQDSGYGRIFWCAEALMEGGK